MGKHKNTEYRLIVEGSYQSESEAEHALLDPFIEDWVEQTGRFRLHNMEDIKVAKNISLAVLRIKMLDEEVFEITCEDANNPLTFQKAQEIAETIRLQGMFDYIEIEPIEEIG